MDDRSGKGKSAKKPIRKKNRSKIHFPSWRSLIIEIVQNARKMNPEIFNDDFYGFDKMFSKLDLVNKVIAEQDPVNLILFLAEADASYQARMDFQSVFDQFRSISVRPNEFYAVFDLYNFQHKEVDPKIRNILGLEPSDFTLPAMAGWDPKNPLFHKRDNNHVLRFASIAYYMFTLRLFLWNSMEDQYRVRFRVGTSRSSIKRYRDEGHVALEKLCFLFYDRTEDGSTRPIYHFDKWLVYPQDEFDFVKPAWLSTPDRQTHLNNFFYLLNAYLININPQYLLFLHERSFNDRNKAIALEVNEKIKKFSGLEFGFEEHQVADCFTKTIRNKLSMAFNLWDKRSPNDTVEITNEVQAVQYAKLLGLLPIPELVAESMYKNVYEI